MGNIGFFAIVPQKSAHVVEFLGKYNKTLDPGFHFLLPFIQVVKYRHLLKEQVLEIHEQEAVTKDNVHINIDGVLYIKIDEPYKASYGAEDPIEYSYILAQSIMRAEIGKLTLDRTFEEREFLNQQILNQISMATEEWGVKCLRYEIKDMHMSDNFKHVLNLQAESERQKRAEILLSEGEKQALINKAEGVKREIILKAEGTAQKIFLSSKATAERIKLISQSIHMNDIARGALKLRLSESVFASVGSLAAKDKTILLKSPLSDPARVLDTMVKNFDRDNKVNEVRL